MRAHLSIFAVLAFPLIAFAQDGQDQYQPAIDKGLAWLAKQQGKDGSWDADGPFQTANTAFAGMAFLAEGTTTSDGKYKANLRRALAWFAKQKPDEAKYRGVLGDVNNPRGSGRYMTQHGVAMSFLSKLYGEEENPGDRAILKALLNDAVVFAVNGQSKHGGWFYVAAFESNDATENAQTAVVLQGLLDARDAGLPVPRDALKRAYAYVERCTTEAGGISYSGGGVHQVGPPAGGGRPTITAMALAAFVARDGVLDEPRRRWFAFCAESPALLPKTAAGERGDLLPHYYFRKVVYHVTDAGWAKAFPNKKRPDHLVWKNYRTALFDQLARDQDKDGSWSKVWTLGPVYNTSLALNILLYENSVPFRLSR
jgi:hypothetical protein